MSFRRAEKADWLNLKLLSDYLYKVIKFNNEIKNEPVSPFRSSESDESVGTLSVPGEIRINFTSTTSPCLECEVNPEHKGT